MAPSQPSARPRGTVGLGFSGSGMASLPDTFDRSGDACRRIEHVLLQHAPELETQLAGPDPRGERAVDAVEEPLELPELELGAERQHVEHRRSAQQRSPAAAGQPPISLLDGGYEGVTLDIALAAAARLADAITESLRRLDEDE
jgi:hypothetical protein